MEIRRRGTCRCVGTSSSVLRLNKTCLVQLSLVMRHGFLRTIRKSRPRAVSGSRWRNQDKSKSQSHVDHVLRREEYCQNGFLAKGPDEQSASLHDLLIYASFSVWKETRVVAGLIVAASTRQCIDTKPRSSGSFWPRGNSPYCNNLSIHLILLHGSFSYSLSAKGSSRGTILKS